MASAFERMADRLEALEGNGYGSDGDRFTRHIRRYMPFYALASIWALMLILLPTRQGNDTAEQAGQVTSGVPGSTYNSTTGGDSTVVAGTVVGRGDPGGSATTVDGTSIEIPPEVRGLDPLAWKATGVTRGGFDCGPGIRQLPWSEYAAPCYPKWTGNNGGATAMGVTAKEITVLVRDYPDSANSQALDAGIQQAGFASEDEREATTAEFVKYFNKVFELWGRQVKYTRYYSEYGDSTQEAQSKGKEGACADADSIKDKYKPFLIISTSSPFGECAAERHMNVYGAGAYYPESWYKKYHPYIFAGVTECERIAYQQSEYIGKRLANRPATWAKNLQKNKPRVFGTYVPDNDQYQHCVKLAEQQLKQKYGVDPEKQSRYNYILDISRFPDEAAKGIVQFNADGVTTVLLACDFLSPIFLTQSARGQEFFPEWIINGAGLTDVEQFVRLYDQEEVQWSYWGMSQLGDTGRILGPQGEGTVSYKRATGTDIPPGAQTEYYAALALFSILQAAGPILTTQSMVDAYWRSPPGGAPHFEVGYTSYLDGPDGTRGARDHTAIDDTREIYYLCTTITGDAAGTSRCSEPKGSDGKGGTFKVTYGGKRFRNGEWPKEDPPIYPEYPG